MSEIDLLLNDIEMNCEPAEYRGFEVDFMIDCVAIIEDNLSPAASAGLLVCRDYLSGKASLQVVQDAILECWAAERQKDWSRPFEVPELPANRAVLCLLKKLEGDEADLVDGLSFFLNLIDNVEAQQEQHEALLRQRFAACLADS